MSSPSDPYQPLLALVGTVVDERYRVEAMIGRGGMGAIFRARREGLDRPIALKVLHPAVSSDPLTAKRFEREAHSISTLDHPGIVRVSDYGTTKSGLTFLVMELIEGRQLSSLLGEPMAPARAADLITQVLEALDHAHARKIVHRDLKPDNVLVDVDAQGRERAKIVDFGIAKVLEEPTTQERLTQTGFVYGTPHYMSPEQAVGGEIDHRADLYAVGLILYEMLAGFRAFRALDPASMLRKQVTQAHDPLPDDVPKRLAHIVDRLLEKAPEDRFQSAREVLQALAEIRPRLDGIPAAVQSTGPGGHDAPTQAEPVLGAVASASTLPAASVGPRRPRPPVPSSRLPWAIASVSIIGMGAAVGYLLSLPTPSPSEPAPTEPTPVPAQPEAPRRISILIRTNVEADIVDVADGGIYGKTNVPFAIDKSELVLQLVLRAEGYEDRSLQVKPNGDKAFDQVLREVRPRNDIVDLKDPFTK